ncbi:MAG: hypothetical protein K8S99_05345 [Planctomycetes bacterium]|nr:hypothetical protein [Planctomycetota bacterium]
METSFSATLRKRLLSRIGKSRRAARGGWAAMEPLEARSLLSISIGSLVLDNPVVNNAGSELTITASNITDSDPGATIKRVKFYADVNGDSNPAGADPRTDDDICLGSARIDADGNAVLSIENTRPRKFPLGDYKITAVVADSAGATGFADADITVNPAPPTIADVRLLSHRGTIIIGTTDNKLTAWVLDPGNAVQTVDFFVNQTPSGVVDPASEPITGTLVHRGRTWTLKSASMPGDLVAGTTVEIIARATDVNGATYTQTLAGVEVVAPEAPTVTKVFLLSHHGTAVPGTTDNFLMAHVTDPDRTVQTVDFFVNPTPSGVVDSASEAITGTLARHGRVWHLKNATMPGDLLIGSTVEIIARATDVNGVTYTQTLGDVEVQGLTPPSITDVELRSHQGNAIPGTTDNLLVASIKDPDHLVQTVAFFVNATPSGVVDANSEGITGTLVRRECDWVLKNATMPGDLVIGTTVEIIAQATDVNGATYTQTLAVQVVAVTPPSITTILVPGHEGKLVIGGAHNTLAALVADPDRTVQTIAFFVNQTPSGVVDANSEAVTGTLAHLDSKWVLKDATLPGDLVAGTTVEIIAQATDVNGATYTQTLAVQVVAATPPSITSLRVLNSKGALIAGSSHNTLLAMVSDPDCLVESVEFFVNLTPSGVVDSNSEPFTGTVLHYGNAWLLKEAAAPADLAEGMIVEVIARAKDVNGQTYTLALEDVSVVASPKDTGHPDHPDHPDHPKHPDHPNHGANQGLLIVIRL